MQLILTLRTLVSEKLLTFAIPSQRKFPTYSFFGDPRLTWDLSLVKQSTFLKAIIIISFPDIITIIQRRQPPIPKKLGLQHKKPEKPKKTPNTQII